MNAFYLQELGIKVDTSENIQYHDDGLVNNLFDYKKILCIKYGCSSDVKNNPNQIGQCIEFLESYTVKNSVKREKRHIHTFILKGLNPYFTAFCKGHEETHVLFILNELNLLERTIEKMIENRVNFSSIDEEIVCNIGGFYSIFKKSAENRTIKLFTINLCESNEKVFKAKEWWLQNSRLVMQPNLSTLLVYKK